MVPEDVFSFISKHARRPIQIPPKLVPASSQNSKTNSQVETNSQNSKTNSQVEATSQQTTSSSVSILASSSKDIMSQSSDNQSAPTQSTSVIEIGKEIVGKNKVEKEPSSSTVTSAKSVIEIGQEFVAQKKAALLASQTKQIEPNPIALSSQSESVPEEPNDDDQDKGLFRDQVRMTCIFVVMN